MEIIIFLHRLFSVLLEYLKELEEESIPDNFVIIYELLDEMMDFGILQDCVMLYLIMIDACSSMKQVYYTGVVST